MKSHHCKGKTQQGHKCKRKTHNMYCTFHNNMKTGNGLSYDDQQRVKNSELYLQMSKEYSNTPINPFGPRDQKALDRIKLGEEYRRLYEQLANQIKNPLIQH